MLALSAGTKSPKFSVTPDELFMKNLILSVACGLSYEQLLPFVTTAQKHVPDCEIVIFTAQMKGSDIQRLRDLGIRTTSFRYFPIRMRCPLCLLWPAVKIALKLTRDAAARQRMIKPFVNLFFLRNILFYEMLRKSAAEFRGILLTDCRDVVFQSNPFRELPEEPAVFAFQEHPSHTIGTCPVNASMVKACVGEEGLKAVAGFVPSCAGTILGNLQGVLEYLRTFTAHLPQLHKMRMIPGDDQGLHNFLIYTQSMPSLHIRRNSDGPIATLGIVPDAELAFDADGFLVTHAGGRYAVLHQYDRRQSLRCQFHGAR